MRPLYGPRKEETPLADGRLDALALCVLKGLGVRHVWVPLCVGAPIFLPGPFRGGSGKEQGRVVVGRVMVFFCCSSGFDRDTQKVIALQFGTEVVW